VEIARTEARETCLADVASDTAETDEVSPPRWWSVESEDMVDEPFRYSTYRTLKILISEVPLYMVSASRLRDFGTSLISG